LDIRLRKMQVNVREILGRSTPSDKKHFIRFWIWIQDSKFSKMLWLHFREVFGRPSDKKHTIRFFGTDDSDPDLDLGSLFRFSIINTLMAF